MATAGTANSWKRFHPRTRADWRRWLARNQGRSSGVWLVYWKKASGRKRVAYSDAVEEALCFGWVDSLPRALDRNRSMLLFTPRNARSSWSKANRDRVRRLVAAGRMAPAGLAAVKAAKASGAWESLEAVESFRPPGDLAEALRASPAALEHFRAFPPSSKKIILSWILGAKRPETRRRRIMETVRLAARGLRANHWRQPGEGRATV